MSRNKDIEFLHQFSGLSYKECRKKMKENHWNLIYAMAGGDVFKFLDEKAKAAKEMLESFSKALQPAVEAIVKIAKEYAEYVSRVEIAKQSVQLYKLDQEYVMPYVSIGKDFDKIVIDEFPESGV